MTFKTEPLSVSNLANAESGTISLGQRSSLSRELAQGFSTGPNAGGYTLLDITIDTDGKNGSPSNFQMTLNAGRTIAKSSGHR